MGSERVCFHVVVSCWAWFFAYCYCVGRAKRASKASERSSLVLALGFPCLPCFLLRRFLCSTMVCLLSLLSLALPCVTCFNSPKTISLLLLHASITLTFDLASRSLLRQVIFPWSLALLGCSRALLGRSWAHVGPYLDTLCSSWALFTRFEPLLG